MHKHGNPNLMANKYGSNYQTWKPDLRLGFSCLIIWPLVLGMLFSKLLAPPDPTQPNPTQPWTWEYVSIKGGIS
jgi:hypothetical protein